MEAKVFHLKTKVFDSADPSELEPIVEQVTDEFDGTFYEGQFDIPANWEDSDFEALESMLTDALKADLEELELDPEALEVGVGFNDDETQLEVAIFYDQGESVLEEGQGTNADSVADEDNWGLPSKKLNPAVIYKRMKQDNMSYEVKVDTAAEAERLAAKVIALGKRENAAKDFVVEYNKKFKILSLYEKQPDAALAKA